MTDRVRVTLDDGQVLEGRIAIDAEGTPPRPRQARFCALLAELEIAGIAPGLAIERFTREGPLALLPLPPGASAPAGRRRVSMIWCQPAARARERQQMDAAALCAQIGAVLGPRLGSPLAVGARHLFPLATHRRARVVEHRLVHLGNAAQALHPVAGQGFNLGLRDCACLAEALIEAQLRQRGGAFDPITALPDYLRRRRVDRRVLPALTSALPPLFSSRLAPLAAARAAGLVALDTLPGLRRAFTRLLMHGAG